jgi:hypothetical protein
MVMRKEWRVSVLGCFEAVIRGERLFIKKHGFYKAYFYGKNAKTVLFNKQSISKPNKPIVPNLTFPLVQISQ